jgi:hypothetical protein
MTSPSRQAIVDALGTVEGVTPHPSAPDAIAAGDGWPAWESGQYRAGKLAHPITHTYSVFVVLPAGYLPDTVNSGDALAEPLMSAMHKIGDVDLAEPVLIPVGNNATTLPAIRVRVTPDPC